MVNLARTMKHISELLTQFKEEDLKTVTQKFVEAVRDGSNCCLTGGGGVGKTWTINKMIENTRSKRIVMTASTGVAATLVNGTTVHRFTGMGGFYSVEQIDQICGPKKRFSTRWMEACTRMQMADILVIDEVSMLAADQIDLIDLICRKARNELEIPFGGLQVILVGDFLQLPPVIVEPERKHEMGKDYWAFNSKAWVEGGFKTFHLTEVKRQTDVAMINALNEIRMGNCGIMTDALFKQQEFREIDCKYPTILMPKKNPAQKHNLKMLKELAGEEIVLKGHFTFHDDVTRGMQGVYMQDMKKSCQAEQEIIIKPQARVMLLKNNPEEGYVNGSTGTFLEAVYMINTNSRLRKWRDAEDRLSWAGYKRAYEGEDKTGMDYWEDENNSNMIHLSDSCVESIKENPRFQALEWQIPKIVKIQLDNKKIVYVGRSEWDIVSGNIICSESNESLKDVVFSQYPIRLAWAITIHKSQGMTLDYAEIHCNNFFSEGHAYVALSRVKTLVGMRLIDWHKSGVFANCDAVRFYKNLEEGNEKEII